MIGGTGVCPGCKAEFLIQDERKRRGRGIAKALTLHRLGIGVQVTFDKTPSSLTWPALCVVCGRAAQGPPSTTVTLILPERVAQWNVELRACARCARRIKILRIIGGVGGLGFLATLAGLCFGPSLSPEVRQGGYGLAWLAAMTAWVCSPLDKDPFGIRWAVLEDGGMAFWFRRRRFARAFYDKNLTALRAPHLDPAVSSKRVVSSSPKTSSIYGCESGLRQGELRA